MHKFEAIGRDALVAAALCIAVPAIADGTVSRSDAWAKDGESGAFAAPEGATLEELAGKLGIDAAFASPELTAEDYLALPRQSCLPMGMVLSGWWPVGIARHGMTLVKANEPFFSPMGEGFWGRNYGRNLWLYPAWPMDLSAHRQELEAAGYAFFARLDENLPPNMPPVKRSSEFNWNGSLL